MKTSALLYEAVGRCPTVPNSRPRQRGAAADSKQATAHHYYRFCQPASAGRGTSAGKGCSHQPRTSCFGGLHFRTRPQFGIGRKRQNPIDSR